MILIENFLNKIFNMILLEIVPSLFDRTNVRINVTLESMMLIHHYEPSESLAE